jgi:hypothetical protein
MRVHTKVVFDMAEESCPVISDDFYEYTGDWAKCDGGGGGGDSIFEDPAGRFSRGGRDVSDVLKQPSTGFGSAGAGTVAADRILGIEIPSEGRRRRFEEGDQPLGRDILGLEPPSDDRSLRRVSSPPASTIEDVTDLNAALEEFQLRQSGYRSVPLPGGSPTLNLMSTLALKLQILYGRTGR